MKVKAFVLGIMVSLLAAVGLSMAPAASAAPVGPFVSHALPKWVDVVGGYLGGPINDAITKKIQKPRPTINTCGEAGKIIHNPWVGAVLPKWMLFVDSGCWVETAGVTQSEEQQLSVKFQKQDAAAKAKYSRPASGCVAYVGLCG